MKTLSSTDVLQTTELLRSLPQSITLKSVRRDEVLDYAEIERRVAAEIDILAPQLPDTTGRVVIATSDPVAGLITLFATWVAGHCAVLVNPKLAADEKNRVIAKVTPSVWVDDGGPQMIKDVRPETSLFPDAALILMTSGTTGDPKGVTHSLATLEARLKLNVAEIGTKALAHTLCPLPLFFGHGLIGNCLTALYAGQNLHILDAPGLKEYAEFGAMLDRFEISFLSSVPSMWRMVLRMSPPPTHSPLRVHVGSAPMPDALWAEIEEWCGTKEVLNTYGMTETANWISGGSRPQQDADGYVGKPWGGTFRVLRDGKLQNHGRGEVALLSPSLMLGLWGGAHSSDIMEGHFMTGDIGELDADQALRLVGRTKNEINRGGIKVLAEEVDMLLERHPDVAEACAFGIPEEIAGELVGAVVRLNAGAKADVPALITWCRAHARAEAVPSRLALVDEIAKTDRGKLARKAIQEEMIRKWL
ncbi:MAG: fatty acid--CoA ligase family protein [Sulfitobacter sp.]